jgi:hypothetical protein
LKNHGPCIYFDTSTKGVKRKRHNAYRADITVGGGYVTAAETRAVPCLKDGCKGS